MNIPKWHIRRKLRRWWLRQRRPDAEERERQRRRILFVERHIMWPIKLVVMLLSYLLWRQLIQREEIEDPRWSTTLFGFEMPATHLFGYELALYLLGNLVFAIPLILAFQIHFRVSIVQWCAFLSAVLDNLFLSALIHITTTLQPQTGGINSVLYWVYCGAMVRNALYFPVIYQQALINLSVIGGYTLALYQAGENVSLSDELFRLRITVLGLVGVCCWGINILLERQRRRNEDRHEYVVRSEKIRATGHLAAEVAHQLKNPLGIINNAAFNLQRSVERGKPVTTESVQIIRQEVQRADRILSDLLSYSGISEGNIESVDLNQLMEDTLAKRLPTNLANKVVVRKELEEGLPPLYAQRRWLEECFLNLIVNAVEAMPNGGTLTVRSRSLSSGWVHVEVQDTGEGIPREERAKIFEPFYTTKKSGTGLGLSIVRNVVETYGGRISVQTADSKGACFLMELPLHTDGVE